MNIPKVKKRTSVKLAVCISLFCLLLAMIHFGYAYSITKNIDINDYVAVAYTTEYEETAYPGVVVRFDQIKVFDLNRKLDRLYESHLKETYDRKKEAGFVPTLSDVFAARTRENKTVRNGDDIVIDIVAAEDFSTCDPQELLKELGLDIPTVIHYTVEGLKPLRELDFSDGKDLNSSLEFYGPDGDGSCRFHSLDFGNYSVNGEDGDVFTVTDSSYDSSSGYRTILNVSKDGQNLGKMELGLVVDGSADETGLYNGDMVHVDLMPDDDLTARLLEEGYTIAKNGKQIEVTGLGSSLDTEIVFDTNDLQQLIDDYNEYLGYRAEYHSNLAVYYARLKPETVTDPDLKSDQLILFLSDQGSVATSISHIWLYNIYRDTDGQIKGEYGYPVSTNLDYAQAGRSAVLNMLSKVVELTRIG